MQHVDEDDLSLVALGEPASSILTGHLQECGQCRQTLNGLREVVALARDDRPVAVVPPPAVWAAIAAATGVGVAPVPGGLEAGAAAWAAEGEAQGTAPARLTLVSTADPATPPTARPVDRDGQRPEIAVTAVPVRRRQHRPARRSIRRGSWRVPALAAAALLIGAVAGSAVTSLVSGSDPAPTRTVVAQTPLVGLAADPQAAGEAVVATSDDGARVLSLDVSRLGADPDGFYEVWLIDASVTQMVPLGVLHGRTGEFVLPDGLDLAKFPVVDVSVEPLDGDPAHSGTSVLRGSITA